MPPTISESRHTPKLAAVTTEEIWLNACVADSLEKMKKSSSCCGLRLWRRRMSRRTSSMARGSTSVDAACMLMLSERFFPHSGKKALMGMTTTSSCWKPPTNAPLRLMTPMTRNGRVRIRTS